MQLYGVMMSRVGDLGSTRDRPIVCFSDDDASAEAGTAPPGRAAPAAASSPPPEVIVVDDVDGSVEALPDQKRRRTDTPVVQAGAAAGRQPPMQVWLKEVLERYPNVRVRVVATIGDSQIVSLDNATAVLRT